MKIKIVFAVCLFLVYWKACGSYDQRMPSTPTPKVTYDGLTKFDFRQACEDTLRSNLMVAKLSHYSLSKIQYFEAEGSKHWYLKNTVKTVNGLGLEVVKSWDCVSVVGSKVEAVVN